MKFKSYFLIAPAVVAVFVFAASTRAQGPAGYIGNGRVAGSAASAPSQSAAAPSDEVTTKKIRASIAADKSLSADARKVKIVTTGGKVTLTGQVLSDNEKSALAAKAAAIAGDGNVNNQLILVVRIQE